MHAEFTTSQFGWGVTLRQKLSCERRKSSSYFNGGFNLGFKVKFSVALLYGFEGFEVGIQGLMKYVMSTMKIPC